MKESTRARSLAAIEVALSEIHSHPERCHTVGSLAAAVHLSPVRFHRVFKELMRESVGAYVRRARLERAVALMRSRPDMLLSEVALRVGYSELSAFSRAFRQRFGLPPARWDRRDVLSPDDAPARKQDRICQAPGSQGGHSEWDLLADIPAAGHAHVAIQLFPARRWGTLRVHRAHDHDNLRNAFDTLDAWLEGRDQIRDDRCFVGFSFADLFSSGSEGLAFDLAYSIDADVEPSEGVFVRETTTLEVAAVHCFGGVEDFVAAWHSLQRVWLPESPYAAARGPTMEVYYDDPRESDLELWDMDCLLPIERIP